MDLQHYWRVAPDQYACVPPPGFEIDPAVTAAIREFDEGMVPIWRLQFWRFPGSAEVRRVVHHGIARHFPFPRCLRVPFHVELPPDFAGPAPNMLDTILEDDETLQYKRGGPGAYIPWDWAVYRWCRFQFDKITVEAWTKRSKAKHRRLARERQALLDELEYRKKHLEPWIMKKLGSLSAHEDRQWLAAAAGRVRPTREKKPFVHLVRSPRDERTFGRVAPAQALEK